MVEEFDAELKKVVDEGEENEPELSDSSETLSSDKNNENLSTQDLFSKTARLVDVSKPRGRPKEKKSQKNSGLNNSQPDDVQELEVDPDSKKRHTSTSLVPRRKRGSKAPARKNIVLIPTPRSWFC